ncbi:MAG TPA: GDSL-type esterase/lipase family protein [Bryobacteraceae bacterium]|nr:GDSL-type esterase/lipase family protein [Bryobacteraceae bacterium]
MRALILLLTIALWAPAASAQDVLELCGRVVQLIDSTRVSVPELARAGEPVAENARQTLVNLRAPNGAQNSTLVYAFLLNLRAYLALTDAVPKPAALSDEGRRQFHELRDAQDRLDAYFRELLARKEAQLRDPDRDALARYSEANLKLGAPQASRPRIVFLGDSITDLWRLNEYFSSGRDFVNRGISGQITGQMLGRMMADVVALKPAAVLVLAGTNDIARGVPLTAIQDNLTMIAALAEAHKVTPVFASLLPVSGEQVVRRPPETIRALNGWLQKFCRERDYVYVDYYSKTVDSGGLLQADLADDGLHPNSKGYRIMAPIALEAIDRVLQPPAQKKRR